MSESEKEVVFRSGCDRLYEYLMPNEYRAPVIEMIKDTTTNMSGMYTVDKIGTDDNEESEETKGYSVKSDKDDDKKLEKLEKKAYAKNEKKKLLHTGGKKADQGLRVLAEKAENTVEKKKDNSFNIL